MMANKFWKLKILYKYCAEGAQGLNYGNNKVDCSFVLVF